MKIAILFVVLFAAVAYAQTNETWCLPPQVSVNYVMAETLNDNGNTSSSKTYTHIAFDLSTTQFRLTQIVNATVGSWGLIAVTNFSSAYRYLYQDGQCNCTKGPDNSTYDSYSAIACWTGVASKLENGNVNLTSGDEYTSHYYNSSEVTTAIVQPIQAGNPNIGLFVEIIDTQSEISENYYYVDSTVEIFSDYVQSVSDSDFTPPAAWGCPSMDECTAVNSNEEAVMPCPHAMRMM
jgi:hypothetical protein